jgi:hypothetical protein
MAHVPGVAYGRSMPVRRVTRRLVASALREVADALGVEPDRLSSAQYRAFRAQAGAVDRLPSDLTIMLLHGSWSRACEEAARWTAPAADADGRPGLFASPRRLVE